MICSYFRKYRGHEVSDPFYGGEAGFEKVMVILKDACEGLLQKLKADL